MPALSDLANRRLADYKSGVRTGANDVTAVDETQQPAGSSSSLLPRRQSDHVAPSGLRLFLVRRGHDFAVAA